MTQTTVLSDQVHLQLQHLMEPLSMEMGHSTLICYTFCLGCLDCLDIRSHSYMLYAEWDY